MVLSPPSRSTPPHKLMGTSCPICAQTYSPTLASPVSSESPKTGAGASLPQSQSSVEEEDVLSSSEVTTCFRTPSGVREVPPQAPAPSQSSLTCALA